ncbi:hypothetical protein JMJ56_21990 [Belnapia sp. T18]|uniref:Uncharacterized protein n=1 Tax=Belnapia arida TaxID=2804533 RepID=A0ABS1UAG1_9PROT|nr:hypothetical protein [Belnapia arida]MBL6080692.1 hypothetical protein [Belnapia arida]
MFGRLCRFVVRSANGIVLYIATGTWPAIKWLLEWLADKLFGDTVFSAIEGSAGMILDRASWELLWTYGVPALLFLLGTYFFWRSERRGTKSRRSPADSDTDTTAPAHKAVAAPLAAVPHAATLSEPDWAKLYETADEGKRVQLRFLPDTQTRHADALLLVVLGYKVMLGRGRAFSGAVDFEVHRALHHTPNSNILPIFRQMSFIRNIIEPPATAQQHIDAGFLQRTGLAEGGYYQLTPEGEWQARMIAGDLIRRA